MENEIVNHTVEKLLLNTPGVVNYCKDGSIEVKPGIWSPIYVNLKNTFPDFKARRVVVNRMVGVMDDYYDSICGVESGGNYHAAAIADALMTSVVFLRKTDKEYGVTNRCAGIEPRAGSKVALIDDVLATGGTIRDAVRYFKEREVDVSLYSIFSYGFHDEIQDRLQVPVRVLSTFDSLAEVAVAKKMWNTEDVEFLNDHIETYIKRLVEPL